MVPLPSTTKLTDLHTLTGIRNGAIKVDSKIRGQDKAKEGDAAQPPSPSTVSIPLNSNDALYVEIRDLNIEQLGPCLGQKAKLIRGHYDAFRANRDNQTITEIHDFVKQVCREIPLIMYHTTRKLTPSRDRGS